MKKIISIIFLCFLVQIMYSQNEFKLPAILSVDFNHSPSQLFTDTTGSYSNTSESLNFHLPVFQKINTTNYNFFALFINTNGSYEQPYISLFQKQHSFIKAGTGLTALYHWKRNTLISSVKINIAEDKYTIYNPYYRFSGTILYNRKNSDKFSYLLGTAFADNYGSFRILPILGLRWKSNDQLIFRVIFPLSFNLQYEISKKTSLMFSLSPKGNRTRASARDIPSLTSETFVYLRVRHIDASASIKISLTKQLALNVRSGILMANKIFITTENQSLKYLLKPGIFFGATIVYRFHKNKIAETNNSEATDDNDMYLDELNTDDITNY